MGYYDDDGNYHRDAYDDDHLDLKDIGDFCERHFTRRNADDPPQDMTEDERRQNEQASYEIPPKEDANFLYGTVGSLLGIGIAFLLSRIFGTSLLLFYLLAIGGSIAGRLIQRICVEEREMTPKELLRLCLADRTNRFLLISAVLVFIIDLILKIRYS